MWDIAIHGGAGEITPQTVSQEKQLSVTKALRSALESGVEVLKNGGTAEEAVIQAVVLLENAPEFNAGRGSVLSAAGAVELDASLMCGADRRAGAVAGVKRVANPVLAARHVMNNSPHVLMIGADAEAFLETCGIQLVDNQQLITEERHRQWLRTYGANTRFLENDQEQKYGTVGAVARDSFGNVAAATSTGGTPKKLPGRVGDSPIVGAGCWADSRGCAVSCTGYGEFFMRNSAASALSYRMMWQKMTVQEAARHTLDDVVAIGGAGGIIAIAPNGDIAMPFSTPGMYRGKASVNGEIQVEMF